MSNPLQKPRTSPVVASLILACSTLLLPLVASPDRAAAVGPQGELALTMPSGTSGTTLKQQGVRISAVRPTTRAKAKGGFRYRSPVLNVTFSGEPRVPLRGGLVFKRKARGKIRQVKLTSLAYEFSGGRGIIRASHQGKRLSLFEPRGLRSVNFDVGTVELPNQHFKLTRQSAGLIKKSLKLRKLPAARLGTLKLDSQAAFEDPYAELCDLPATSKTAGDIPPPGPLPDLNPSAPTSGEPVTWGFKASYRGYIFGIQGVFEGEDGAIVNYPMMPGPPPIPTGFTFPFDSGDISQAGDNTEAIINGSGKVTTCHKGQFRLTMSDPTVYVDSEESRIIMTIDTNVSGSWIPSQRVDFATLDTSGAQPTEAGGVFTWNTVPAALTAEGAAAIRIGKDFPGYGPGDPLDPITVRARVPAG